MNADIKNKLFMVGYLKVLCQKAEEYYSDEKETEFNKNFSMIFEYIDYMRTFSLHAGYNQIPLENYENVRVHKGSIEETSDEKQQPVKSKEETVFEVINKDDGFIFEDYLKAFELAKFFNLFYCKSDYTLIYKKTKVEILDNFKIIVKLEAKEKYFVIIIKQNNCLCDFVISDSYEEHFENLKKYSHLDNYILYIYESLDFGKRQTNIVIKDEKEYVKYYNDIENKVK